MYTKQQASAVRQKFWTGFGQYLAPVPGANGEKINWVNYKTGVKGIFFKQDADNNRARTVIEISLSDKTLQGKYFDLFSGLKKQFEKAAGKDWDWKREYITAYGERTGTISAELNQVNIFRETDWPAIISFLKKNIIALDNFWNEYKPVFEIQS